MLIDADELQCPIQVQGASEEGHAQLHGLGTWHHCLCPWQWEQPHVAAQPHGGHNASRCRYADGMMTSLRKKLKDMFQGHGNSFNMLSLVTQYQKNKGAPHQQQPELLNHAFLHSCALGMGTLLFDLLNDQEAADRRNVFDIPLLASRLVHAQQVPLVCYPLALPADIACMEGSTPNRHGCDVISMFQTNTLWPSLEHQLVRIFLKAVHPFIQDDLLCVETDPKGNIKSKQRTDITTPEVLEQQILGAIPLLQMDRNLL
eukprot:1157653-Pelagomonas_calceolata.AAC.8